jgi:hypothetical protein
MITLRLPPLFAVRTQSMALAHALPPRAVPGPLFAWIGQSVALKANPAMPKSLSAAPASPNTAVPWDTEVPWETLVPHQRSCMRD